MSPVVLGAAALPRRGLLASARRAAPASAPSPMAACTLVLLGTSALVWLYCTKDCIYINRGKVGQKVKMRRLEGKLEA